MKLNKKLFFSLNRFVNFLKKFSSDKMDIAFSAERSIEDGIEEMSAAEASTVIISYSVMFVYVAIALGKIKNCREFLVNHSANIFPRKI